MDIRYSCNQKDFKRYTTEEMRDEMLRSLVGSEMCIRDRDSFLQLALDTAGTVAASQLLDLGHGHHVVVALDGVLQSLSLIHI